MKQDLTNAPSSSRPVRSLRNDTQGAGLVEYIILVGLIALLAIAGFEQFGSAVNNKAIDLGTRVGNVGNNGAGGGGGGGGG